MKSGHMYFEAVRLKKQLQQQNITIAVKYMFNGGDDETSEQEQQ